MMTSLGASLPQSGSSVWRKDRSAASFGGRDPGHVDQNRVRHVVIRETETRSFPSVHTVYKIDVLTQSNHWCVFRRYREFYALNQKLIRLYGIARDWLPPKRLTGNLTAVHVETRKEALESYLQRLVNSDQQVAVSKELLGFLDVYEHDVNAVMKKLAQHLYHHGDELLEKGQDFCITPDHLYCICKQLKMPVDESDCLDVSFDVGHVYSFVYNVTHLTISSAIRPLSVSNMRYDLSLFKSLTVLKINCCDLFLVDGLGSLQTQLTKIGVHRSLKSMQELFVDSVIERRQSTPSQASLSSESWRRTSLVKFTESRAVLQPWRALQVVNVSHNVIKSVDQSIDLMPHVTQMSLSHNELEQLDLEQLRQVPLVKLDVSFNLVKVLSPSRQSFTSLKEVDLSNNRLHKLIGCENLVSLVRLSVRNNLLAHVSELNSLVNLMHLAVLEIEGNPLLRERSYRTSVFARLHHTARQLLLDGIKMSRREESSMSAVRRHLSASGTSLPVLSSSTATSSSTYHSHSYSVPAPQHPVNSILRESELIRPTPSKEDSNRDTSRRTATMTLLEMAEKKENKVETGGPNLSQQCSSESESSTQSSTVHSSTVTCSSSGGGTVPTHTPQEGYEWRRLSLSVSPRTLAAALCNVDQPADGSVGLSANSQLSSSQSAGTTHSQLTLSSPCVVVGGDEAKGNSGDVAVSRES